MADPIAPKRTIGVVATCLGLGLTGSWWPMLRTAITPWLSGAYLSWYGTLSLDIAYVIVQVACLVGYRRASRFFDNKLSYTLLGGLQALLAVLAIGGMGQHGTLTYALVCCAAVVNSLLFLGWSRPLTCVLADCPRTALVLAAMTAGMTIWVGVSRLPVDVALWLTAFLPIGIGMLALLAPTYVAPVLAEDAGCSEVGASRDSEVATSLAQRLRRRMESDFALIPPLFLLGAFILELAPGFIMGVVNLDFDGSGGLLQNPYVACTGIMALICLATIPIRDADRLQRLLERFVMPLLSLGLLAFSLLTPTTSVIGPALTIAGSNVIEACFFTQFARTSHEHGVEPVRVFSLGGIAIQLGSLAAYLLGPIAHGQAQSMAAISLALVFVLILFGTANGRGLSFGSLGPASGMPAGRAATTSHTPADAVQSQSDAHVFASHGPAFSTVPGKTTAKVSSGASAGEPTGTQASQPADAPAGQSAEIRRHADASSGQAIDESPITPYNEVLRGAAQRFASEHGLSERERDVLMLAVQGKNTATMADQLCIAQTTVKTHLKHIYQKAGVADRQELIALFERFES